MFGFNRNKEVDDTTITTGSTQATDPTDTRTTVQEDDFIDTTDPNGETSEADETTMKPMPTSQTRTVIYSMGMPIDGVYIYMEKDWEEEGIKDALNNPDISYMTQKVDIIRQGLVRRFDMTRLKYNKMIRDSEAQIDNLNQFGLGGTMNALTAHIDTCKEHIQKLDELERRFQQDAAELRSMTESYKRGFSYGVAKRAMQTLNTNIE